MANCYIQILCGMDKGTMVVGREYDFAIGEVDSKISPESLLDIVEKLMLDGLLEKYKDIYDLERKITYVKEEDMHE